MSIVKDNERLRQENGLLYKKIGKLEFQLSEANNMIAHLEFELESLKRDAGEEINKWMLKAKEKQHGKTS